MNTDLLLLLVRNLLADRTDLKLVLMSATIKAEKAIEYFTERGMSVGTVLDAEGTNYPIKENYLEEVMKRGNWRLDKESTCFVDTEMSANSRDEGGGDIIIKNEVLMKTPVDLIRRLVVNICDRGENGAILVFLPGWEEIEKLHKLLLSMSINGVKFFLLHSSATHENMDGVWDTASTGTRKIILATNVAESSITIPDVVHVIDSGKQKVMYYDRRHRMDRLETCWVSRANMHQRRGRAGRTQPGHYYGIFRKDRCDIFPEQVPPEIMRLSLDEVCLTVKSSIADRSQRVASILHDALDRPEKSAIDESVSSLYRLGALQPTKNSTGMLTSDRLTHLGRVLSTLPMHPAMGKMLISSALMGCLNPVLTVVASMGENVLKNMKDKKCRESLRHFLNQLPPELLFSDHLLVHELWLRSEAGEKILPFVSFKALDRIRAERRVILRDLKQLFDGSLPPFANENENNSNLVRLVLASGLLPDYAVATQAENYYRLRHITKDVASGISSSCHNYIRVSNDPYLEIPQFFLYADLMDTGRSFITNLTAFDPILLPMFGCKEDWIGIHGDSALSQVKQLKSHWDDYIHFMFEHQHSKRDMTSEQREAARRFRKAVAAFATSTVITRKAKEATRLPLHDADNNFDETKKMKSFNDRRPDFDWDFIIPS